MFLNSFFSHQLKRKENNVKENAVKLGGRERERKKEKEKMSQKPCTSKAPHWSSLSTSKLKTSGKNFKNSNGIHHNPNNENNTLKMYHFILLNVRNLKMKITFPVERATFRTDDCNRSYIKS